ncbi:Salutaridinol 7-O-acetyltransferase [Handroanthus impetiginosus]|uniref:Salutaridinol 7-O-acetyltransferase n=1 Tax=Handroanthus impetiginosus TaxID=429701 RepID=A0A2G9G9Q6_9LAMI|nr:Salutaridinol 7-O-acetyltransferase [Handroanthus impetiginosus]
MKMEVEIISKDHIKPSSPTPHHLKTHKLSLLDQIVPPIYVPLVLYYPNLDHKPKNADFISQTTQILKQSLSSTLSRFYPLAGRVRDSLSIDCNDEGVLFVVTKFPYHLLDFLKKPDPATCRDHIPSELTWAEPGPGSNVAVIQVNYFDCGGIAVGSLFLHKVADGVTIGTFIKAWATAAAAIAGGGGGQTIFPNYTAQYLFPQNETMKRESHLFSAMRQYFKFGKTRMRRYVFDASAISKLRAKLDFPEAGSKQRPTRVETVSALIWKCFTISSKDSNHSKSLVTHGVNMRRKSDPPFHEHCFGNFVWLVPASSINNEADRDLKHLFGKVRNAINKVDVDFVTRMQGKDAFSGYCKNLQESWNGFPEDADYLAISSWCNFGLYGIDFGWGRPAWITKCDAGSDVEWPFINVLWLMDTKEGDGIEAWLTLDEEYFEEFDRIEELRDLALIDPSPLENSTVMCNGV